MLTNLKVNNFALIEDIDINFEEGLTVLTGETGTGKSIILESLQLIFAKRSDQEMIRHGSDKAIVTATFKLPKEKQTLLEIPEIIVITREIDKKGRHKITLNDKPITLNYLKYITDFFGSIHNQDDSLILLNHDEYINFIDQIDSHKTKELLNNYLLKRSNYLEAKKHLDELKEKKDYDTSQKEFLEYQLNEIKALKLVKDEKENLELTVEKLKHFDKISSTLREVNGMINNSANIEELYNSAKLLDKIKNFDEEYLKINEKLFDLYYELDEIRSIVNEKLNELDFDENEFNLMQERIFAISKLEEKYKKSANELIQDQVIIEEKLSLIENYDEYLIEYNNKVNKLFNEAYNEALKLSNYRKKLATKFSELVVKELKDLDLNNTKFEVAFKTLENTLLDTGIDEIEFLVSLNEGEPLRTLSKVASGGERARFTFAIKTIYAKQNNLDILILDEIDIGISGKVAAKVANKMYELSKELQLIVISHLPQVAARADNHYGITKQLINNRMVTNINRLEMDERIKMIAMMLSDESLSPYAIEQAKMLLKK